MSSKRQQRNVPSSNSSPESIEDSPLEKSVPEDQANTEENNSQSTATSKEILSLIIIYIVNTFVSITIYYNYTIYYHVVDPSARHGRGYTRGISLKKIEDTVN